MEDFTMDGHTISILIIIGIVVSVISIALKLNKKQEDNLFNKL